MKCPKCGQALPEDSVFCQFCGCTLSNVDNNASKCAPESENKYEVSSLTSTEKTKVSKNSLSQIFAVIFFVLFLFSGSLNVFLYWQKDSLQERVKTSEQSLKDARDKLQSFEQDQQTGNYLFRYFRYSYLYYSGLQNTLDDIAMEYNAIGDGFGAIETANALGYASDNFNVNAGVLSIHVGQKNSIILTAYWPQGGKVSVDTSKYSGRSNPVSYRFCQDSWDTKVEIEFTAYRPGVQILSFTNDVDAQVFDVVVIVR